MNVFQSVVVLALAVACLITTLGNLSQARDINRLESRVQVLEAAK